VKQLLMVLLGGGMGSVLRYYLGIWLNQLGGVAYFWGTLSANVVACLLLGLLVGLGLAPATLNQHPDVVKLYLYWPLLATGFCGGLSTFSTLMLEVAMPPSQQLTRQMAPSILGQIGQVNLGYLVLTLVLGILSIWLGARLGQLLGPQLGA
jgi:fluoride ion exporter CrcB/FEX